MTKVYMVISRRYIYIPPELQKVFDNPESAAAYAAAYDEWLSKGPEEQCPYRIEVKEYNLHD